MLKFFHCFAPKKKDEVKEEETSTARAQDQATSNQERHSERFQATARAEDQATSNQEGHLERFQETADNKRESADKINAKPYTFLELGDATKTFHRENLLGEDNFSRVYKGTMGNEIVAVKTLDSKGSMNNEEFCMEVLVLSLHSHPNLVKLIGYCCDGDQKLLVYEYTRKGSLDRHLFNMSVFWEPLSWNQRMIIACDVAQGLEYLHAKSDPPIIYGDLKCSNILLGGEYAKISYLGQAKFGHVLTGYAPEYLHTQELTVKSDIYCHGVLMLELITARKAVDNTNSPYGRDLVMWAKYMYKDNQRRKELVDPRLEGQYHEEDLNMAQTIAMLCVEKKPELRPTITDVIKVLMRIIPYAEYKKRKIRDKSRSKEPVHDVETVAEAKDQSCSSSDVRMAKDKRHTSFF